jgi:hypothetical protein
LQKQLTGNESAHTTAVNNANSAHSTATANAEAARKSAEQAALTQLNSTVAQATKDKEASIAGAERTYDQAVASLDAQYGSASSNGDTGVEGATRRSAIKTRDAQYYAARDTSWANTLSGSTTLGTSPWTVKAIAAANGQAAYSTSRASAQAAHDVAMLDAMEDWQLSSRESLTDVLFTEGQSRETYNVATSNVYANWENGVGNLLGDKPEGTGWEPVNGNGSRGEETGGGRYLGRGFANFTSFGEDEETEENQNPTIWPGRGPGHIPPPAPNPDGTLGADKEYEKLLKYIHTPGVDLTQIPLQLDGMHEKMAEFVANHADVYKELTLKFGVSYQHKLNEFFKHEFTIEDANRDIFYQYYNFEHPTFYLDSNNTWFWSTSADVKAGYLKYILDEVGSRHDAVKNPILQAGDIAVWFSPYRSVLESGTHFAPEIRRAVIQANADLAREVALNAAGEKGAEVAVRTTVHFGKIALQQLAKNPEWMSALMKGTKAPVKGFSRLFGHNEYKVVDEVLAGKVKSGLLDFFNKNGGKGIRYVDDALLEGRNGAMNNLTGEIWISKGLRDKYPHLVEGTIMEELQHFHQVTARGWFGRILTDAEHNLLEAEVVRRLLRSGLQIHN